MRLSVRNMAGLLKLSVAIYRELLGRLGKFRKGRKIGNDLFILYDIF